MRTLFLALLLANLAFFAWARWLAPSTDDATISAPLSVPKIMLAGERRASPMVVAAAGPGGPRCVSVGPFATAGHAASAAKILGSGALGTRERSESATLVESYWVYVGGFASAPDVMDALRRLRGAGFAEAEAMPPSPEGRRVSAGTFRERERADSAAARVQRLGLQPVVAERTREAETFWVDLQLAPGIADPVLETLQGGVPSAPLQSKSCPAVSAESSGPVPNPPAADVIGRAATPDEASIA
ncbi:MAG: SPOR domain-containing protein [Gammaproteobacteria bacterium]|nr:SPOR domain-containing protein [Gammaproteobacteria bacterium]